MRLSTKILKEIVSYESNNWFRPTRIEMGVLAWITLKKQVIIGTQEFGGYPVEVNPTLKNKYIIHLEDK